MFDPSAPDSSKALVLQTLESLQAENVALKQDLFAGAARSHTIKARVDDLRKLIKGEVRVAVGRGEGGWKKSLLTSGRENIGLTETASALTPLQLPA